MGGTVTTVVSLTSCRGGSRQRGEFPRNTSRPQQISKIESDTTTTKLKHGGRNRGPISPEVHIGVNVHSEPNIPAEAAPSISTVAEVVDPIRRAAAEARAVSV